MALRSARGMGCRAFLLCYISATLLIPVSASALSILEAGKESSHVFLRAAVDSQSSSSQSSDAPIVTIPVLVPSQSYREYFRTKLPDEPPQTPNQTPTQTPNQVVSKSRRTTVKAAVQAGDDHAGQLFAISLLSTTLFLAIALSMASSSNLQISGISWITIDNIVTMFIAILWFKALDAMLSYSKHSIGTFLRVWLAYIIAAVVLFISIMISHSLRKNRLQLAIFCSCSTELAAFTSMLGATDIMEEYFSGSPSLYFGGMALQVVVLMILVKVLTWVRKAVHFDDDPDWNERVDNMENEFGAMALAVTWSLWIRFLISNSYSDWHSHSDRNHHSQAERWTYLVYILTLAPLGSFLISRLASLRSREDISPLASRAMLFCEAFLTDCIAWGLLFLGQWEVQSFECMQQPVTGRVYFALGASILSCFLILLLAPHMTKHNMSLEMIVSGLSVLIAWTWEESFDEAIESLNDMKHQAYGKLVGAALFTLMIMPVYAAHLKPAAMEKRELLEKKQIDEFLSRSLGN